MSELLPTVQADDIQTGLLDYLTTTFALADQDARLALTEFLRDRVDGIFKGPYLRLRLPFRPAQQGWQQNLSWPGRFQPYGHQAQAFARLSSADLGPEKPRPLPTLITTGTGSGKTEAFLYPILDHVLRERRAGRPGMKALILYPMNALANDQAARLAGLISSEPRLAGVTAAIYTGQEGPQRTKVSSAGLITDRGIIRDQAPDILLTNYKMLDQLLLRYEDQPLWRQSALSLRYLVLDEFHTYDGAQGTDVAMLLRRLGLALKSYWPEDDSIRDDERVRPLGRITPVATSATLGDRSDPAAMVRFARTVFGEHFDEASVVTESRLDLEEWIADARQRIESWNLTPVRLEHTDLAAANATIEADGDDISSRELALRVLSVLYDDPDQPAELIARDESNLLALVQANPLIETLIRAVPQAVHLEELADQLFPRPAAPGVTDADDDRVRFLLHLVALLSHVRATCGRDAVTVDLHLWVRELTRVDRVGASTAKYLWSDDGALTVADTQDPFGWEGRPAFPAVYCRHCGRSGWGIGLGPTGNDLDADDTTIRRNHAAHEGRFRALLYAPMEADHVDQADHAVLGTADRSGGAEEVEGLRWFAVRQRAVLAAPPADDDPDFRDGWVLPVLSLTGQNADEQSRNDTCPSCLQTDGIRFLGSAIATLLSVTLSTLFGAGNLDPLEKKALVFTDSVQDAAHRAGFVESRSHTLTMRSVLRAAVDSTPITLDLLAAEALRQAGTDRFRRYRLIPPDLVQRDEFAPFWQRAGQVPIAVRRRVQNRLLFDAVMEFGLQSRVGRTLEQTGSVVAEVDAGSSAALAAIGRAVTEGTDGQDTLDEALRAVPDAALVAWVRGVLEHMRERGAVEHPWFAAYIKDDGNRYHIWKGRPKNQGMPAFPFGRAVPAFPRVGPALKVKDPLLDPVTSAQSWYARWATRNLPVSVQHGARLAKALLERLVKAEILQASATDTGGTVYSIPAAAVVVGPAAIEDLLAGNCLLTCSMCRNQYPGTRDVVRQLEGAPCLLVRCPGRLVRMSRPDNYYRRLYASADVRRIVAREHSSVLEDVVRQEYERQFRSGHDDPQAPNVLVATPTLEMGIDIGDLSTVMLASLPRSVASYLQRVGRAGRLTGNALNLAFVTGRGEHLPQLGDPLSVINGQVRPPATYLNAEEILQRQYVAHLIDHFARDPARPHPQHASTAIESAAPGSFLGELITFAEGAAEQHTDRFLGTFTDLTPATVSGFREWTAPGSEPGSSALAQHLYAASRRWAGEVEALRHRQTAIQKALPELQKVADLPAATDDDVRAVRSAQAALRLAGSQLSRLRTQFWIQVLEEHGILPNYTLLDDSVTLDVALTWIDPETLKYESEEVGYRRSSARALHEFAPGAVFYARGLEIHIDSIDLGMEGDAVRPWAFCPDCGYARDRGTTGTLVAVPSCPRCGGAGISDTRQHLEAVELTRVSAEMRRDEAAITDRRDERHRERFAIFVAADVDPARIVRSWYVEDYDFSLKYLRRMDIRWVNAGRSAGYSPAMSIAGGQRSAGQFRVCAGCGKLDRSARSNRPEEHRPWCRYRKVQTEHVRPVVLTRSLSTQGVVLRIPSSVTIGDIFAVPSLATALLLGLRDQLGGSPDHLAIAQITDPTYRPGGGDTRQALLLHDIVPGGTGYLAELADPVRLWDLLYRAWTIVRDCPCQNETRLACHRCLLPFAGVNLPVDLVSRQAAERHLRAILTSGRDETPADDGVPAWAITDVPPVDPDPESHLEQLFRKIFRLRVTELGATVHELPGPRGNNLRITLPGATRQWTLQPQVLMGGACPDFVLQSTDPGIPAVAIFADGWRYHASPAHNRLADDARKRRDLRDSGVVVLAVTAQDIAQAETAVGTGSGHGPGWLHDDVLAMLMQSSEFPFTSQTVEGIRGGPFAFLLGLLQQPTPADQRALADGLPFFFVRDGEPMAIPEGGDLAALAGSRLTDGHWPTGSAQGTWWQSGYLGVLTRISAQPSGSSLVEVAVVLDDREGSVSHAAHKESWAEWLRIANALNLRTRPTTITTVVQTLSGGDTVEGTLLPAEGVPGTDWLPQAWRERVDLAVGEDERDLLMALARTGSIPPPVMGYESADGIPIDAAWPDARVAVYLDPDDQLRQDLEDSGWHVTEPEVEAVQAALARFGGGR